MREAVIVIPDLFISSATSDSAWGLALPGLEALVRFGTRAPLEDGWRPWLARWMGRADLAQEAPATVASAGVVRVPAEHTVWIATPVHLLAGLTSVHVGGIVALDFETCAQLVRDFNSAFAGSGHHLHALPSENLILSSASLTRTKTVEPARCIGSNAITSLAQGLGAAALLRLGSEIEMWLHAYPRNASQVSTLWLWGGGRGGVANEGVRSAEIRVFGNEPYVAGLRTPEPLPPGLDDLKGERAVIVAEMWRTLRNPQEALVEIDRRWLAPARALADRGAIERVTVLANDRQLTYRGRDRLKKWRRRRGGLAGLL